ncbi:MAG: HAD family hydrolase [Candidatus Aenigmatarchaeota archaeon]
MYRAFLTDYMGTLRQDGFPDIIKYFETNSGLPLGDVRRIISKKYWPAWSLGEINEEEFWKGVCRDTELEYRGLLTDSINSASQPIFYPMLDFFEAVRKEGRKTGLITNISRELLDSAEDDLKVSSRFDIVVPSFQIGLRKPDPRIYRTALKILDSEPSEAVYIDNEETDVEGAQAVGIKAVKFKSVSQAVKDLEELRREV